MNVLLKVSVFGLQSNSYRSISKINYLNQISYLEQPWLKLLRNQVLFPFISIFIAEVSQNKQWYKLTSVHSDLTKKENLHQPQMLWVANQYSVRKLIRKRFINDPLFTFTRAQFLGTVS